MSRAQKGPKDSARDGLGRNGPTMGIICDGDLGQRDGLQFHQAPGPPRVKRPQDKGSHTVRRGELDEDAVAAQRDDEGLLAHAAALRLPGHRALEHTHVLICGRREARMSQQLPGPAERGSPPAESVQVVSLPPHLPLVTAPQDASRYPLGERLPHGPTRMAQAKEEGIAGEGRTTRGQWTGGLCTEGPRLRVR